MGDPEDRKPLSNPLLTWAVRGTLILPRGFRVAQRNFLERDCQPDCAEWNDGFR